MNKNERYLVVFKALELACEHLKIANIEINDSESFDFLINKLHDTLIGYYILKAEKIILENK